MLPLTNLFKAVWKLIHPIKVSYSLYSSTTMLWSAVVSVDGVQNFAKHLLWRQGACAPLSLLPFSQNSSPCEESSDRQCILEVNKCHWNEQSTSKRVKISSSWVKQYCILKIYYAFEHGHCEGCKTVITINSRLHSVLIIYVNCEQLCQ